MQVTFANLARKKAAKEQIVLIPEWQNIVNFADSFDPIVRREVCKMKSSPYYEPTVDYQNTKATDKISCPP